MKVGKGEAADFGLYTMDSEAVDTLDEGDPSVSVSLTTLVVDKDEVDTLD